MPNKNNNLIHVKGTPWTIEQARHYANERGYTLLDDVYVNTTTPMNMICSEGHEYSSNWRNFYTGHGCSICGIIERSNSQSHDDDYLSKMMSVRGYTFIKKYRVWSGHLRIEAICPNGHSIDISRGHFQAGVGCKTCKGKTRTPRVSKEDIKNFVESSGGTFISADKGGLRAKLKTRCSKCGDASEEVYEKYKKRSQHHLCVSCANALSRKSCVSSNEKILNVFDASGMDVLNIEAHRNARTKLRVRCQNCEKTFLKSYAEAWTGSSCPKCRLSHGERRVYNFLTSNNIKFVSQKRFDKCRNKKKLPFDFYLPKHNLAIEYNGGLHYFPVEYFGGDESFNGLQERDEIKRNFCEDNKINLLVIPYWDYENIEEILKKELLGGF